MSKITEEYNIIQFTKRLKSICFYAKNLIDIITDDESLIFFIIMIQKQRNNQKFECLNMITILLMKFNSIKLILLEY